MKRIFTAILLLCMLGTCLLWSASAETQTATAQPEGIVVLYTNDVHCEISGGLGYADLAAYKNAYLDAGYDTLLVDCGDIVSGGTIGIISKGKYMVQIMNEVGYNVVTPGNHEFDFGITRFLNLVDMSSCYYVSANFLYGNGEHVLAPYVIYEDASGDCTVAFVGVSTPLTLTQGDPTMFVDENGEAIYSFGQGDNGERLYAAVQEAVDDAIAEGADVIVALSHLGVNPNAEPYRSTDLIANTTGIDVVLDGHSHTVIEGDIVTNKDGEAVLLSSTGSKFENIGVLTIGSDAATGERTFTTELRSDSIGKDPEVESFIDDIQAQLDDTLGTVIAHTDCDLKITDPATEQRMVRTRETNLGDLCADAFRTILDADIAFINGGNIRADVAAGDITYRNIIDVCPFDGAMSVVEATGQQILDALELGASALPDESGGFLQVSGLTYEIDMNVESSVVREEDGQFVEVAGARRVQNVTVAGEPIDPDKTYILAGLQYILQQSGDGMNMFKSCPVLQEGVLSETQVIIEYITETLGGNVGEEYADPYGQGRITILQ